MVDFLGVHCHFDIIWAVCWYAKNLDIFRIPFQWLDRGTCCWYLSEGEILRWVHAFLVKYFVAKSGDVVVRMVSKKSW